MEPLYFILTAVRTGHLPGFGPACSSGYRCLGPLPERIDRCFLEKSSIAEISASTPFHSSSDPAMFTAEVL